MLHTSGGATTAATIASGSVTAAVTAGVTGVTAGVMAAYGLRAVAVSCDSSSADPWVAYVDVASGRTYFHNAEAQQTVWEKPPADAPVSPLSFERETATVSPGPKLANGEPPSEQACQNCRKYRGFRGVSGVCPLYTWAWALGCKFNFNRSRLNLQHPTTSMSITRR